MADANSQQPQVPTPAPSMLKASSLIKRATDGIPELVSVEDSLKLVFGVYAQCVVPKLEKKKAASLLSAFFQVKPSEIQQAVIKINKVVLESSQAIAEEFQASMEIEVDPRTLDISRRTKEEVDEQNELDALADQVIANVTTVVTSLGVNDLYAQELEAKGGKPRKSLTQKIVQKAVQSGWLSTQNGRNVNVAPELGWNTPPALDTSDDEVSRLQDKIDGVLTLISDNAGSPTLKEQVLAQLENFGVTVADLESALYKLSKLAHEQLDQSEKILERVKADQASLAKKVEAINFVKGVYAAVLTYFFPEFSLKGS